MEFLWDLFLYLLYMSRPTSPITTQFYMDHNILFSYYMCVYFE